MKYFAPHHRTAKHQFWAKDNKVWFQGKCFLTGIDIWLESHHIFSAEQHEKLRHKRINGVPIVAWAHKLYHLKFLGGYKIESTREKWDKFCGIFRTIWCTITENSKVEEYQDLLPQNSDILEAIFDKIKERKV